MANETMLNSDVANANATVLNTAVNSNATVLNTDIVSSVEIQKGTVLCDDYTVNGKLDIPTGEADLYLCTKKRQTYVAKVYRRKSAIKDEIIKKLLSINSPYVAKIYASGSFNGFPVEILPYYKNGSLKGEKFTLEELKEEVIPSLNEGLHALHEVGIIHKDLKPSNIMLSDDGQSVAIIDFGISSVRENDATVVVTRTGMTPEYSAPETFRNAFLEESDYYSLGITIFELYYGKTPYDNMDKEKIAQYVAVQKIPLPDDMPQDLKDLVNGLTYPDITNRKDKSNPNRRWGYEQVKAWCEGKAQELPGSNNVVAFNAEAMKPYPFIGIFSYRKIEGGIKVIRYKGVKHGTLIIPDIIDGRPVVSIGKCAFERMYFKKIILPQFCTVIEAEAFCFCLKLQEIELPEALIRLGECAFYGCRQLTKVIFSPNIREIQMGCFSNCSRLEAVILNDGIEIIEESAFKRTPLKKVILPESVKLVKGHQESPEVYFPLKDDTFPFGELTIIAVAGTKTKFEDIPRNAIIYCLPESSVQKQAQALGVKVYPLDDLNKEFAYREIDGEIEILGCNNPRIKTLIIPETIKDKTVVGIGANAFKELPIVKAVIPSTIKYIKNGAFKKCDDLKTVDISYGVERFGDRVFLECECLEHISLPNSLFELGKQDFKSTGLVDITIPKRVDRIPKQCFHRCRHLKNATLNDELTKIGEGAFFGTILKEIIIPESVNTIENDAFAVFSDFNIIFLGAKTEFYATKRNFDGVIYCLPGSEVEKQARLSGLEVRPLSEFENQER